MRGVHVLCVCEYGVFTEVAPESRRRSGFLSVSVQDWTPILFILVLLPATLVSLLSSLVLLVLRN